MTGLHLGVRISNQQADRSSFDGVYDGTVSSFWSYYSWLTDTPSCIQVDHGPDGLLAYALHPGGVLTDMAYRLPKEHHVNLTDKPELAADTVAFLTRERREFLAGRYVSCEWIGLSYLQAATRY